MRAQVIDGVANRPRIDDASRGHALAE